VHRYMNLRLMSPEATYKAVAANPSLEAAVEAHSPNDGLTGQPGVCRGEVGPGRPSEQAPVADFRPVTPSPSELGGSDQCPGALHRHYRVGDRTRRYRSRVQHVLVGPMVSLPATARRWHNLEV